MPLTFTVKIKGEEYIKLNYRLLYSNPLVVLMIVIPVLVILYDFASGKKDGIQSLDLFLFLFTGYMLVILPILVFYRARRNYNLQPAVHQTMQFTVNETGVNIKGETFEVNNTWDKYSHIKINTKWVILFKGKNFGNFIPRDSFKTPQELEQLISFAKQGGVAVKGKI